MIHARCFCVLCCSIGLGSFLILIFIVLNPKLMGLASDGAPLDGQWVWLGFCLLLYPSLGWLFGSYTVLRWRSLPLPLVLQRLFYTGVATLMMVAVARWLVNPNDTVWLVYRRVQFVWLGGLTVWVLCIRFALRRGLLLPDPPKLLLLAADDEINDVLRAWNRISPRQQLEPVSCKQFEHMLDSKDSNLLVALTPSVTTNKTIFAKPRSASDGGSALRAHDAFVHYVRAAARKVSPPCTFWRDR